MVFSPPLGEAPRRAERRFGASGPGAASAPGWARGRCLWPPRGDFERLPRSWTEWGGPGEDSRGPAAGPTASFCLPAFLLLFILRPSPLAIAEPGVASEN
uniref:Uncharacterized protein n=1 Tax=Aotus nancymaae TaxID=37293 RepID=A0A2K5EPJ2_AOTNA